jgi:hypothetical protein
MRVLLRMESSAAGRNVCTILEEVHEYEKVHLAGLFGIEEWVVGGLRQG